MYGYPVRGCRNAAVVVGRTEQDLPEVRAVIDPKANHETPMIVIINGIRGRWIPEELSEHLWKCIQLNMFSCGDYQKACIASSALVGNTYLHYKTEKLRTLEVLDAKEVNDSKALDLNA